MEWGARVLPGKSGGAGLRRQGECGRFFDCATRLACDSCGVPKGLSLPAESLPRHLALGNVPSVPKVLKVLSPGFRCDSWVLKRVLHSQRPAVKCCDSECTSSGGANVRFVRTIAAALLFLGSGLLAAGQTETVAQRVYSASKESVFLVYLNDSGGKPTALGSAFLVAPHTLVTNAHVVDAGAPVLAVGPVRVPLKVVRVDEKNDLAILSVDIDLTSSPLSLSSAAAVPGEQVYAIGNPEGLQNTISQGIVSGIRQIDDHDLLQVTCPISHGSSGGPILNSGGEVIGVAVGMLEDGQNLNFAVPVKYVRALLSAPESPETTASSCAASMSLLNAANGKRGKDQYSSDASSPYQQDTAALLKQARIAVNACSQPSDLQTIACLD